MRKLVVLFAALLCLSVLPAATAKPAMAGPEGTSLSQSESKSGRVTTRTTRTRVQRSRSTTPTRRWRTHPRPVTRVYHYPVVYRPWIWYRPAPVVIVQEPTPVVVVQPTQPVEGESPTPVMYQTATPSAEPEDRYSASLTFRLVGMNTAPTQLSMETVEGSDLVGLGSSLRFDLDRYWGLELGVDILGSNDGEIAHLSVPVNLSLLAHMFPGSIIDPYALAGIGLIFNEFDDSSYGVAESYTQWQAHVGFGLEASLGSILITSDLRFMGLEPRPERDALQVSVAALEDEEFVPVVRNPVSPVDDQLFERTRGRDQVSGAFQFMLGAGWRF